MSRTTSGSAFSFIVTAAVVWGMKTVQTPLRTPLSATAFLTRSVMFSICVCFDVSTVNFMSMRSPPNVLVSIL